MENGQDNRTVSRERWTYSFLYCSYSYRQSVEETCLVNIYFGDQLNDELNMNNCLSGGSVVKLFDIVKSKL